MSKATKLQSNMYEYECACGYIWIDGKNNGCPMCGEQVSITAEPYESLPPDKLNRGR